MIPALNERITLPGLLAQLGELRLSRIVVVDNGSSDGTATIASEAGAEVVVEPARGYGSACLAGIRHLSIGDAPDIVVFLDGDQSDDPAQIHRLVEPIRSGHADLAIGVRTAAESGTKSEIPLHARIGNALVLELARRLHGRRFKDLGPFRAIRFDALAALRMDDRNWGWTLQMQLRAHRRGLRIVELAVTHRPRAGGRSKVSGSIQGSLRAGSKMMFTLVRELLFERVE